MQTEAIIGVFVYGTLKRGQCREVMWPTPPLGIDRGWVHGRLYGRHDYPAMIRGPDRVQGELWRFSAETLSRVLEVLDEVEGTNQPGSPDLYHRDVVEVFDETRNLLGHAFTYRYASDPIDDGFHPLEPNEQGCVAWPQP